MKTEEEKILQELKSFLSRKSGNLRRIRILNFLYSGKNNYQNKELTETTKKNITKDIKSELYKEYIEKLDTKIITDIETNKLNEWISLVDNIKKYYTVYLDNLKNVKRFKYLVVSEAPMLTIKSPLSLGCKYIFDSDEDSTIYRRVPYQSFTINNNKNPTASHLISTFEKNKVLFIDLISIPLPTIDTDIREKWSVDNDWKIDGNEPLSFTLFKISLDNTIKKLKQIKKDNGLPDEIIFNSNLKIILMMPPKTSMGIIDFVAADPKNNFENLPKEINKNLIIKNLIRINGHDSKKISEQLKNIVLRQYRQVVMNSSNNPCVKHFKHAITN